MLKTPNFLILIFLFEIGCNNSPKEFKSIDIEENSNNSTSSSIIENPPDVDSSDKFEQSFILNNYLIKTNLTEDFILVDFDAAIFISPDSLQIEEMKKEYGDGFYVGADDNHYYESRAAEFFEKKKLKILNIKNRYIQFKTKTTIINFDSKAKASFGWTTLLFRTDSLPRIYNVVDFESEYESYFGK